jgi:hypothetical protein
MWRTSFRLVERVHERRRVRDDPQLRALRRAPDEPPERRDEVRVQAGLGLVQHHDLGRARGEQGHHPQDVAQRSVAELGPGQRAQEAVLREREPEEPVPQHVGPQHRAGERVGDGVAQGVHVAHLFDGAQGRRDVAPVVVHDRTCACPAAADAPGRRGPCGSGRRSGSAGCDHAGGRPRAWRSGRPRARTGCRTWARARAPRPRCAPGGASRWAPRGPPARPRAGSRARPRCTRA